MDIVRPSGGGPWPVFVLLQGGPAEVNRDNYMLPLANALAHRGAVVMVADWRQAAATAGGYPTSFQDVACAVGVARAVASRYGGNGSDITLVGHSLGGWAGAVVSLTPRAFIPAAGACDRTVGPLRPDALVDLDGAVDEPRVMEDGAAYVTAFFGGTPTVKPAAYAAGDPFAILARWPAGAHGLPILVVHGLSDRTVSVTASWSFHSALLRAGDPNRLMLIPGGHGAAITSSAVADAIMRLGT